MYEALMSKFTTVPQVDSPKTILFKTLNQCVAFRAPLSAAENDAFLEFMPLIAEHFTADLDVF